MNDPTTSFGARPIGGDAPAYLIAEAGSNHNRDLDTAYALVDRAAEAGADAVKFQTYSGATLYSTKAPRFDYLADLTDQAPHELLEDISLPRDWQPLLARRCAERGVDFLSSPFDRQAVDELDALDVPALKVASFELVDLPFLEYVGSTGRAVILSTGMATLAEVEEAIGAVRAGGSERICLLQCASVYPAPPELMNLRAMHTMRTAFGVPVGLSDHTLGVHVSVAAVGLGASVIEKHYTLDRSHPGPDHPFAIEPDELATLVAHSREVEAAMGDGRKSGPSEREAEEMYSKARRSLVAAEAIPAGTRIERSMLTVKRPGHGIKPRLLDAVVGRTASTDIEADEVITWEMV